MGAYWGTLGMLLEIGLPAISGPRLTRGILRRALQWFSRLLYAHDINTFAQRPIAWKKYTTGYFLKVTK